MPRSKWRLKIVFETELNGLSHRLTSYLRNHAETKVYSRRNTARDDHVAIFDYTTFLMRRAHKR